MYLKIGKTTNKANVKVHGGFIAEMPIAIITSANLMLTGDKTVNVVVNYYKSLPDYQAGEASINSPMQAPIPNAEESTEKRLISHFHNLPLIGEINEASIYQATQVKLIEQFTDVELLNS